MLMEEYSGTASRACEKCNLFCHSERSEESLFGLNVGKERFLGAQRASE
jgi:hypothetical protein